MSYKSPDLGSHRLVYKGRRFWAVELVGEDAFQCETREDADLVIYDRLYDCPLARVRRLSDGSFDIETTTAPLCSSGNASTIREAVALAAQLVEDDVRRAFS